VQILESPEVTRGWLADRAVTYLKNGLNNIRIAFDDIWKGKTWKDVSESYMHLRYTSIPVYLKQSVMQYNN
jgi:hypothetical protein